MEAMPLTVETRLSLARSPAPTGTRTARSARVVVVRDAVREVLLVVRLVRVPALAGVRLVVRLVVLAGFRAPGVVVDISRTPSQLILE